GLVLDVRRQREKPTNLFRAENNGKAAWLPGRDNSVGKIAALQRDPEEEAQCRGPGVEGRYCRSGRRQPQLIATDILRGGLVGRAADEIRKAFDVADILVLSPRAKSADRHVFDQSPAQRTDGLVGHWGILSWVRLKAPQSQDRTPASRYSTCCYQLPRQRFSRVPSMFDSLGVEVPYPT